MKKVVIYTFTYCHYCIKAKKLLNKENIEFEEIVVNNNELKEISKKTNMNTVPQIFVDDILIGGCDDLYALYDNKQKFMEVFGK